MRRRAIITFCTIAMALASPALFQRETVEAHPLHTSLAEISFDAAHGLVLVSLRVFADDFTAASRAMSSPAGQSPLFTYALSTFIVRDNAGHPVALVSCGGKRVGDLMWLCFRGRFPSYPHGASVTSRILFDKYKDQINVVQAGYLGRKTSLLFTPGDGAKQIPPFR